MKISIHFYYFIKTFLLKQINKLNKYNMGKGANCWKYFGLVERDGKTHAKCNVCQEEYSYHRNTTNLNLHLAEGKPNK